MFTNESPIYIALLKELEASLTAAVYASRHGIAFPFPVIESTIIIMRYSMLLLALISLLLQARKAQVKAHPAGAKIRCNVNCKAWCSWSYWRLL
jgi:hypothetical protein